MKFNYQARTKEGKIELGTIEASSREAASALLQKYNIFITSLKQVPDKRSFFKSVRFEKKVSKKELGVFSRQLAVMLESRVPVVQSLSSLANQSSKMSFKKVMLQVSSLVEEGTPLSEAFNNFPKIFDNFFVNLVKSGEISGKISQSLYYISDHLESEEEIAGRVRQAMIYPLFTLIVLFVVVNIIVLFLLPKVKELIEQSTTTPDLFTSITLNFYSFLESWWWIILFTFLICAGSAFFYLRSSAGKKIFDKFSLKIPFAGAILRKVFLSRFCGNISTLIVAGISINRALEITADTVESTEYKKVILDIGRQVSEGEKISSVLVQYPDYYPSFVVQMIKVGEETGKLDKTLMEVVTFYDKEIKKSIDLFLALFEPILIIFLGLVVAFLAISVFAPLYSTLGGI